MSNLLDDTGRQSFRDLIIMGLETVNGELKELRRSQAHNDQDCREAIAELRVVVARLETKIAIYASMGAVLGSAVMTWAVESWRH